MDNVFEDLINEYGERSASVGNEVLRDPTAAGEFFYCTKKNRLYIAGFDDDGKLTWYGVS